MFISYRAYLDMYVGDFVTSSENKTQRKILCTNP